MRHDEHAIAGILKRNALPLVLKKKLRAFRDENQGPSVRRLEGATKIRSIFHVGGNGNGGRSGHRLTAAMRAHQLNGILHDGIGTVALHGVDGSKCAHAFVEIDLQGGGERDHAAGVAKNGMAVERIDRDSVAIAGGRAELFGLDVPCGKKSEALFAEQPLLWSFARRARN